ncbi:hypothetical protein [Halodesulfurarchaeum sp.]|uniref:hypothetical protein n=1 Tax=Halodesulfurarchaeum sp. TaxID=1980530 RepID=UPI001BBD6654|nr:hypothetical protein [Halodesulfurarchaeum sp.]
MAVLIRIGIWGIQTLIGVLVGYALFVGDLVLFVNGLLGLATTVVPDILDRIGGITFSRAIILWIAIAVLLHTLGMAGPYETIWWWDHLTHTLSAALLASFGYAVARALDAHSPHISLPPDFLFLYVFLFTMAAGVLWEVLEFVGRMFARWIGQQPLLVQYGLTDTVLDLLFDGVGALIVGLGGQRWAGHVTETFKSRLGNR